MQMIVCGLAPSAASLSLRTYRNWRRISVATMPLEDPHSPQLSAPQFFACNSVYYLSHTRLFLPFMSPAVVIAVTGRLLLGGNRSHLGRYCPQIILYINVINYKGFEDPRQYYVVFSKSAWVFNYQLPHVVLRWGEENKDEMSVRFWGKSEFYCFVFELV